MNRLILISPYKEEPLSQFFLVKTAVGSEDFSPRILRNKFLTTNLFYKVFVAGNASHPILITN
ncbi:MAG: hypothetical protein JGK12_17070 [Microcoleus sp. PH2017_01_SCD_O_A]|jgi:hypothetical protein|uniref:hypothetical protein n=1 Tax=unclassified Microcoleus TaxID=2642155 RepID=UPI001D8DF341|nr:MULTISPECIES: hypothetical protein [unclassified Microcoleus]MCC3420707.1 hypothetical protein [Microcoleus sp. PH2017_07_MST_O_A]MCC3588046.1 hypothetical protein [Microcoleus sp. PH2017_30_WIL_O_A]MCC3425592.1 hypothetical protein [Microcoleus sp. PH2017_01_SCD_O_A]MCC3449174.1 hypothetical protein [Microcoleus sp. PH2017_09_SFU_O_A]MCC3632421.1 hypothetical protein [Microcoleus sp. PH2017_39_LGB_O_B]